MKRVYRKPEIEITKFTVENHMMGTVPPYLETGPDGDIATIHVSQPDVTTDPDL